MTAVRASILWTDDESLKAIWGEIVGWTAVSLTMDGGESLIDDEDYTKNMAQFIYQAMQIDEDNYEKYLV